MLDLYLDEHCPRAQMAHPADLAAHDCGETSHLQGPKVEKFSLERFSALVGLVWPPGADLAGRGLSIQYLNITLTCQIFVYREIFPFHAQESLAAYDVELAKIPDLYDAVAAASLRLRKERNEYVKINTLPTEILRQIFCLAGEYGLRHQTNFVIVATCARWRAIAFGEPCMWTHLLLTKLSYGALDFYKARNNRVMPLTVVTSCDSWPRFLDENALEVQALHATFSHVNHYRTPPYHKLQLINMTKLTINFFELSQHILSDGIFQDVYRLQYLTLRGCRFRWDSKLYGSNLLELDVTANGLVASSKDVEGNERGILQIFRASPRLRKLRLKLFKISREGWDPGSDPTLSMQDEPVHHHTRIEMDQLRSITLDLPFDYATHILESISLPIETMACFELNISDSRPLEHTLDDILNGTRAPLRLFAGLRELRLYNHRGHVLGMRGSGMHERQSALPQPYTFDISH